MLVISSRTRLHWGKTEDGTHSFRTERGRGGGRGQRARVQLQRGDAPGVRGLDQQLVAVELVDDANRTVCQKRNHSSGRNVRENE